MGNSPEAGSADRRADRRWLKRQIVLWRSLALIAITVLATFLALQYADGGSVGSFAGGGSKIVRLPITGVIRTDQHLLQQIERLAQSDDVVGVILRIDSPGGTFSGSEALYSALRRLADAKPTVAVIDGVGASGAYMAAIAADHIVARAGSITGSVGVIMQIPNMTGLLTSIGVNMQEIRSGPLKATPSPFEETSDASRAAAESIVLDLFDQFLGMVTERREISEAALTAVKSGQVFTGKQALPLGLIDALGGETEARLWLVGKKVEIGVPIRDAEQPDDTQVFRDLLRRIGGVTLMGAQPALDGPWAIWQHTI